MTDILRYGRGDLILFDIESRSNRVRSASLKTGDI